jgi:hypothetical protein
MLIGFTPVKVNATSISANCAKRNYHSLNYMQAQNARIGRKIRQVGVAIRDKRRLTKELEKRPKLGLMVNFSHRKSVCLLSIGGLTGWHEPVNLSPVCSAA